uniref:Xylanolytic transcriptional activator regulatory domain-containing protein n=1 Tax=Bionectria ochroleuca TaxID=29856 RepID=A0A8H7N8V8_BIOOC
MADGSADAAPPKLSLPIGFGFCGRLESLSIELTESILEIKHLRHAPPDVGLAIDDELQQAAHALQSLPTVHSGSIPTINELSVEVNATPDAGHELVSEHAQDNISDTNNDQDISDESIDDDDFGLSKDNGEIKGMPSKFGSLVTDSYGKLRYLGGATNNVLVEAVKGLSPGSLTSIYNSSPGSSNLGQGSFNHTENAPPEFEIPLFVRGKKWQELPYLPRAEDVPRPPKYVADLLVNLYFDQLHYTFPVLYKPHFMSCYRQMSSPPPGSNDNVDAKFLSVFFAVCACASTLIPLDGKSTSFPGLDYYQKSLILYYASTGRLPLRECSRPGGPGLGYASEQPISTEPSDILKQQLSRRIWWSVYCLDRVTSICLGRPMAADDADCHCDLPIDKKDEELETYFQNTEPFVESPAKTTSSPMTGFVAFIQLCRIGGRYKNFIPHHA